MRFKHRGAGGFTIVYFCFGDKWRDWQRRGFANRTASIALELARHPRVQRLIVVNNPTSYVAVLANGARKAYKAYEARGGMRKTGLDRADSLAEYDGQPRKITRHGVHGYFIDAVETRVTVIEQIRLLPKERSHTAAFTINNALYDAGIIRLLRDYLAGISASPLVLWLNSPVFAKFAGYLDEDLIVYDARDDWVHHPQLKPIRRALENGYELVRRRADIVFAVSKSLVDTFSGGRPDVFLVPNGIDSRLFDGGEAFSKPPVFNKSPAHSASAVCEDLAAQKKSATLNRAAMLVKLPNLDMLQRPIIGYVGKMQDRFDVGLMADVARGMPDAGFVLIGPVFTPGLFEPLRRLPNVFFTGRVHQTEVPALIKLFDVCIMPHVKDGLTAAMNPLKLYEYLAYGKPTVCTNAGDLEQFDGLIEIAGDAGEFRSKIEAALDEHPEKKRARIKFAGRQDWSKRVRSMVKEIDRKLFEKA